VSEESLKEGDSVVAGGSTFVVHLAEKATAAVQDKAAMTRTAPTPIMPAAQTRLDRAPLAPAAVPPAGFSRRQSTVIGALYSTGECVFAVLDSTRVSRIPAFLEASGERFLPLDLSGRTPVFVASPGNDSRLLDVLIKDGWGHGWCSYFTARTG